MTSATPPPKPNRAPVIVKPPAPPASATLPQALGAYTLEEVIGQGGMGTVYKAKRSGLDRVMAVKLINAGAFASDLERHRFRVEAENAAKLQHPNIVQVLEV
ncbi:MAG: protein kinase, partial [Candidatus Methylacidiphilales bacterium]|nr:protein kinase [Candidatus Methylacidiphilales bacterium]